MINAKLARELADSHALTRPHRLRGFLDGAYAAIEGEARGGKRTALLSCDKELRRDAIKALRARGFRAAPYVPGVLRVSW